MVMFDIIFVGKGTLYPRNWHVNSAKKHVICAKNIYFCVFVMFFLFFSKKKSIFAFRLKIKDNRCPPITFMV